MTEVDELYRILALEFNKDPEVIEKIVRSQFFFVQKVIEQGEYESVHLHKYGKFCTKPKRLEMFKKINEAKSNLQNSKP